MRALAFLILLASCRGVLGIPEESRVRTFEVMVEITGVTGATDDPIEVFVEDSYTGERQSLTARADGQLMLPRGLVNGADYTVTTTPNCEVRGSAAGRIESAPAMIGVACDGYLGLADFGFTAPLETMMVGTTYRTYGSLLTQHTGVQPASRYAPPAATALAFHDGVQIPTTGFDIADGDDVIVTVQAPTKFSLIAERSYATEVDLGGPPAQFGYGKGPALAPASHYGHALDAYDDYLLVGIPDEGEGRAVLYARRGRVWNQEAVFEAPLAGGRFGASVALGNGALVIGAPGIDKAFLYTRNSSMVWELVMGVDGSAGSRAGAAVAIEKSASPLYFVVGAPAANDRGQAVVYDLTGAVHATLLAEVADAAVGDQFGAAVAISESHHVIVGAPGDASTSRGVIDEGYPESGAVYVFDASAGGQPSGSKLKPSVVGAGDRFGAAVAVNRDGTLIAVGAPLEDSGGAPADNSKDAAGAVYVFSGAPGFATELYVKAPGADLGDGFGSAIAIRSAGGAQVSNLLVVGAPFEDSGTTGVGGTADEAAADAGAVYVLTVDSAASTAVVAAYIKASNTGVGDQFGASVALTRQSLIVGAPYEDSAAKDWNGSQGDGAVDSDNGAVYTFR